ncbi:hypothetical protein OS242_08555 [Tumebacillus sp. DT12]|uniref:Uncharacterized protein n=1 Tax=Tumebacillus lacus TaxID=2995335 RepID=A0ABT3WZC7_9BACL|nr:hypothetical protein [Tumebacillus lacus]MCX7570014.1 hypothetical protein [Tumebacillus lacus]
MKAALTFVSFLLAVGGTTLWYRIKAGGGTIPLWLMGVVAYGWIFSFFMLINLSASTYAKKRRPGIQQQGGTVKKK